MRRSIGAKPHSPKGLSGNDPPNLYAHFHLPKKAKQRGLPMTIYAAFSPFVGPLLQLASALTRQDLSQCSHSGLWRLDQNRHIAWQMLIAQHLHVGFWKVVPGKDL